MKNTKTLNHPTWLRWIVPGFCLTLSSTLHAATISKVTVNKAPVTVEYKTYAAGHLPQGLGVVDTPLGVCRAEFTERASCHAEYPLSGPQSRTATVDSIEIFLNLNIVIWLAEGAGAKVLKHEEAHRAIAEYYYRASDLIARRHGERVIGTKLTLPAKGKGSALRELLRNLGNLVIEEIHEEIYPPCKYAEERFDAITDHGRNKISEEEGKKRAFADENTRRPG